MYNKRFEKGKYTSIKENGLCLDIRVENHFSYQWSKNGITELAEDIKSYYLKNH